MVEMKKRRHVDEFRGHVDELAPKLIIGMLMSFGAHEKGRHAHNIFRGLPRQLAAEMNGIRSRGVDGLAYDLATRSAMQ